jgi:hypothetical protein
MAYPRDPSTLTPGPGKRDDKLSAIKKKAMMKGSPWPNKKAMGFPPMAFEFFLSQNLLRRRAERRR